MTDIKPLLLGLVFFTIAATTALAGSFQTEFQRKPSYFKPHAHDTARKAMVVSDGVAKFTVTAGMYGARSDAKKGKERAEIGRKVEGAVWVVQAFRVRVEPGFKAQKRTMISQIKMGRGGTGSPPIAVYLQNGGEVKCNDYSARPVIRRTTKAGITLSDGNWHDVVMEYLRSDTNGFCRVRVDGRTVVQVSGLDNDANGSEQVARIGVYRDAVPYSQTVYFDNWSVVWSRKVPKAFGN